MTYLYSLFTFTVLLLGTAVSAQAQTKTTIADSFPQLTIYHLEGRRSERLVWLMEELNLPYNLIYERGDLRASVAKLKKVNPTMPMFPTVVINDQVMVESGAIIELLLNRYAPGKLQPELHSDAYAQYLMWMHFAEGTLAARIISDYRTWMKQAPTKRSRLVDSEATVQYAENYLTEQPWFGGVEFSAADIMMLFPLNFATSLNVVDAAQFPKVAAWKEKVTARPAYKRMLEKARPDGLIGALPKLPKHAPAGPRS